MRFTISEVAASNRLKIVGGEDKEEAGPVESWRLLSRVFCDGGFSEGEVKAERGGEPGKEEES